MLTVTLSYREAQAIAVLRDKADKQDKAAINRVLNKLDAAERRAMAGAGA